MKEITILQLIKLILQRIWFIIIVSVIACVGAFCVANFVLPPKYTSSVSMYVKSNPDAVTSGQVVQGEIQAAKSLVSTYIVILNNNAVLKEVGEDLLKTQDVKLLRQCFDVNDEGTYIDPSSIRETLTMSAENDTEVLKIVAVTKNAKISAAVCNILSEKAPDFLIRVVGAGGVETIGVAETNDIPTSPNIRNITILGFAGGLCLAVFIVLLMDFLDNTIKDVDVVEKHFGKPVIGKIHSMETDKKRKAVAGNTSSILDKDTPFHITEAYKTMRSNFSFSLAVSDKKIVVITSANPGEGKSTTAANLAVSLAQTEQKILLIDADMRKPFQHENFKLNNKKGLSNIIGGKIMFEGCVNRNVKNNLDILTSGLTPPNPSELLSAKQTAELFESLAAEYDYIIVDTPPIGIVSDALAMSWIIAGIILVVNHSVTTFEDVALAKKNIELANSNLLGIVLNNIKSKHFGRYYSKSGSYGRYGKYSKYEQYGGYNTGKKEESKK